jgi:WD repeat and SOF domain-containing protein 1
MKVKTLHLDPSQYTVKRPGDRVPIVRNPLVNLTGGQAPNHKQREYVRALNAAKLDRMFAKPFIASLDGHVDSVEVITRSRTLLAAVLSGGADGCINFWDLPGKRSVVSIKKAHDGFVRGLTMSNDSQVVYSVGSDKKLRAWRFCPDEFVLSSAADEGVDDGEDETAGTGGLLKSIDWSSAFSSVDHQWFKSSEIATCCAHTVDVWDVFRSNNPIQSYEWGEASLISCKYNPSETNLLAATMADNSVGLFDTRTSSGIQKIFLKNKSNAICWNPRDPFIFGVANDDGNIYQMDMRKVGTSAPIVRMHTGHVQGVTSVDFSPMGTELVSGGYDKTVRIFDLHSQKSREMYHNKRMQRVLAVAYSGDGRFVLSGSEDTNLRIWKAVANEKLGALDSREKLAIEYRNKLKEKYGRIDEVGKILHHRHAPKWIKNEGKRRADHFESRKIADKNRALVGSQQKPKGALEKAVARVEQ